MASGLDWLDESCDAKLYGRLNIDGQGATRYHARKRRTRLSGRLFHNCIIASLFPYTNLNAFLQAGTFQTILPTTSTNPGSMSSRQAFLQTLGTTLSFAVLLYASSCSSQCLHSRRPPATHLTHYIPERLL